jgi:hypothetical protein
MVMVPSVPAQLVGLTPDTAIIGFGFTVMVNVCGVPVQGPSTGVTVIVAVTAAPPPFNAVNDPMLPLPLAASPIDVLLFVQLNVVPAVPVKFTEVVEPPAQIV